MDQSSASKMFHGPRRSLFRSKKNLAPKDGHSKEDNFNDKRDVCARPSSSTALINGRAAVVYKDTGTFQRSSAEISKASVKKSPEHLSGSRHSVDEFCSFPQLSISSHPNEPLSSIILADMVDEKGSTMKRPNTSHELKQRSSVRCKASKWLWRHLSSKFQHHRRPISHSNCHDECPFESACLVSPMPSSGVGPPKIPEDLASGAAARAAAATQNEILESIRLLRLTELKIPKDCESGIGIEMRDQEENEDATIVRIDPVKFLPEEIVVQILSYLNAGSLIHAELVSRRWNRSASSHIVWKNIFHSEFQLSSLPNPRLRQQFQIGGHGLGKIVPNQDWKRMWRVRKALHQRWQDGHAAAIYLDGHTDSVYCVQFDEHKILTGSRDRTIRVWDAHTYECIKVVGVARKISAVTVPPLPSDALSRGQRPFLKFFSPQPVSESIAEPSTLYHRGSILSLQYNDDIMITGSSDCTCIVWDMKADYLPIRQLRHHTAGVLDVCFDDKFIVSCSKDTTVCIWDRHTGEFLRKLSGHRGPVNAVQLRGNLVVSASGDGVAKLWNLTSGLCIKEFLSKDRGMACVEFSPDSRTILAGGNDQVIYQFDTNTGELVRELSGHRGLVRSLHLDSSNGRIVSGSYDTSVKAYDLSTGDNIVDFAGWTSSWILSAKADYRRIIATSQDTRTVIMDFGYELPGIDLLEG